MFVLLCLVWIGSFWLNDSYFFVGIFFAPFVLTLIMGATRCLFRKQYLKNESVQYILFLYSFRRYFDTWCCLALACLCFFIIGPIIDSGKSVVFTFFYIVICLIVAMFNEGKSSYDALDNLDSIESKRISTVKVFLLALVCTPIAGYIAARMYKAEQDKKTKAMELHRECAETYLEAKDYTNAIVACKEGVDGTDKDEDNYEQRLVRYDILRMLAEIYCKQEKNSEAIKTYREAMFIFPHDQTYARSCIHSIVGNEWAYESTGIANKALDVVKAYEEDYSDKEHFSEERIRLMQIEESVWEKYEKSADVHITQHDYANAIADYTKAIELAHLAPEECSPICKSYYYHRRAQVYTFQEDYANAIADSTKAIELALKDDKSWYYGCRAKVYLEKEDYVNAIADYTKAIEIDLQSGALSYEKSDYYSERAKVYLEQKDYENALVDYTIAIKLVPEKHYLEKKKAQIYKERGETYQMLGDMEQAEADFAKAKELEEKQENE